MHFHRDVLVMADVVARHLLRTGADDVYTGSPPLGFTFGLGALLVFPLRFRAASVLLEAPTAENLLTAVQHNRVTGLFTTPVAYRSLLPQLSRFDLSSLRLCVSAGEMLPRALSDAWFEATGLRIIDGIGATEMMHIFISARGDDVKPGSTGRALPGYEACILDESGHRVPPGAVGRLAVKGPTGCRYLDDPRQSEYVRNGWNLTGDLYLQDEEGYFWFQARADDMIISAGYNIAGPEVEAALLQHPVVQECAVVAAPDADRGSIVKAYVVLLPGHSPGPDLVVSLQNFVKNTIAPYKYPRAIEFVAALPKTPTGKVQRSELRRRAAALN
jgi:2-aminobenzoate-CoA ligase